MRRRSVGDGGRDAAGDPNGRSDTRRDQGVFPVTVNRNDRTAAGVEDEPPAIRDEPPAHRLSRGKRILFSLVIAVMLLGVVEVGLRVFTPRIAWSSAHYLWEGGAALESDRSEWPRTYPKNARGRHAFVEFDVPVAYNADGFRGADFDPTQGPVVIFLGDSTTAGHGIRYDDMFTTLVAGALRERFGRIAVWNLGRAGSGPVVQARLLDRILARYPSARVEAIVLISGVSTQRGAGNDLLDMQRNLPYLDGGRPEPGPRRLALRYHLRRVAIIHGAEWLVGRWRREHLRMPRLRNWDGLWRDFYRCLDRMRSLADARGASFIVAHLAGRPSETRANVEEVAGRFKTYLDRYGIPLVGCYPALAESLRGKLYYYPLDGHVNALAHHYIADQLIPVVTEVLESRGLVSSSD